MIRQLIQMLIVLLFGVNNGPKHDLRKKPTIDDNKKRVRNYLKNYFNRYKWIFISIGIVLAFIVFVLVCFIMIGTSAVESGNMYNHFQDVI